LPAPKDRREESPPAIASPVTLQAADPTLLLNQLVEAVPQTGLEYPRRWLVRLLQSAVVRLYRRDLRRSLCLGWQVALHSDDVARTAAVWQRAIATGTRYEVEYRLRRADGIYRWFLARGLPITDASGTILRWFGTSTDIEDQKQEEVRQRFLAELSEQTRLLGDPQDVLQTAIRLLGDYLDSAAPPTAKWTWRMTG